MFRTLYLVFSCVVFKNFNRLSRMLNFANSSLLVFIFDLVASMSIRRWNDAKIAIAIYFVFKNTSYEACAKIIFYKTREVNQESRTNLSVRNKLHDIHMTRDLWTSQIDWNLKVVDDYLISLNVYDFKKLINASETKLVIILEIRFRSFVKS